MAKIVFGEHEIVLQEAKQLLKGPLPLLGGRAVLLPEVTHCLPLFLQLMPFSVWCLSSPDVEEMVFIFHFSYLSFKIIFSKNEKYFKCQ